MKLVDSIEGICSVLLGKITIFADIMGIQKLVIEKQFMGVQPCEIELKRFLLLIGEQASGKSTIAKLIYFFQTLPDTIYNNAMLNLGRGNFNFAKDINTVARAKFVDTFGSTTRNEGFKISFIYGLDCSLQIYQGSDKYTYAEFDNSTARLLTNTLSSFLNAKSGTDVEKVLIREQLLKGLYATFNQKNTKFNYMIAGRNSVVAYPDLIGEKVKNELEKIIDDEVREGDFERRKRRGNEMLFLEFVEWSEGIRKYFKENGGTFEYVIKNLHNAIPHKEPLKQLAELSKKILKGKYASTAYGETIQPSDGTYSINFKDASSGQQEVLRILQGLFISIGSANRQEFMVIEEPEAHLYPIAQKDLINAFAVFLNTIKDGRLIITTHSPYILACVNILLMASLVAEQYQNGKKSQVSEIVSKQFWLNPADFSAYSLGQNTDYCHQINDAETGLIDQNYLDTISEQLGMQFDKLYELAN